MAKASNFEAAISLEYRGAFTLRRKKCRDYVDNQKILAIGHLTERGWTINELSAVTGRGTDWVRRARARYKQMVREVANKIIQFEGFCNERSL